MIINFLFEVQFHQLLPHFFESHRCHFHHHFHQRCAVTSKQLPLDWVLFYFFSFHFCKDFSLSLSTNSFVWLIYLFTSLISCILLFSHFAFSHFSFEDSSEIPRPVIHETLKTKNKKKIERAFRWCLLCTFFGMFLKVHSLLFSSLQWLARLVLINLLACKPFEFLIFYVVFYFRRWYEYCSCGLGPNSYLTNSINIFETCSGCLAHVPGIQFQAQTKRPRFRRNSRTLSSRWYTNVNLIYEQQIYWVFLISERYCIWFLCSLWSVGWKSYEHLNYGNRPREYWRGVGRWKICWYKQRKNSKIKWSGLPIYMAGKGWFAWSWSFLPKLSSQVDEIVIFPVKWVPLLES